MAIFTTVLLTGFLLVLWIFKFRRTHIVTVQGEDAKNVLK